MTGMTDSKAADVLAAHNEWRRFIGDPYAPGAPVMANPTELGLALERAIARLREPSGVPVLIIDHAGGTHQQVVRALPNGTPLYLKPQPPAEAQAQGGGEACPHCKGNPGLDCNSFGSPAPPSAPVGVEGSLDRLRQHRSQRLWKADLVGGQISVERMRSILHVALAQQPAAVDGESVIIDGCRYGLDTVRTALLGLAAQPGGVE